MATSLEIAGHHSISFTLTSFPIHPLNIERAFVTRCSEGVNVNIRALVVTRMAPVPLLLRNPHSATCEDFRTELAVC